MLRWLIVVSLLSLCILSAAGVWAWQWYHTAGTPGTVVLVTVEPGSTSRGIAQQLHEAALLEHPRLWRLGLRVFGITERLQAGEYELDSVLSPGELAQRLVEGGVTQYQVSFVEGWTALDALHTLESTPRINWDLGDPSAVTLEVLVSHMGPLQLAKFQKFSAFREQGNLEGWLFPDTYNYAARGEASEIVLRAWLRMLQRLDAQWETKQENLPYVDRYELLKMASVVEKETGKDADRGHIAQVFVRRLLLGMRLQTDPTIIYGLGSAFDGNLTRKHLKTDGPYNSYTRHGFPPTPIALPSAASLLAAAQPAVGDYLYFVARGDGSSQFSRTLPEHQAAVRRYQLR